MRSLWFDGFAFVLFVGQYAIQYSEALQTRDIFRDAIRVIQIVLVQPAVRVKLVPQAAATLDKEVSADQIDPHKDVDSREHCILRAVEFGAVSGLCNRAADGFRHATFGKLLREDSV